PATSAQDQHTYTLLNLMGQAEMIIGPTGQVQEFAYDAFGNRISRFIYSQAIASSFVPGTNTTAADVKRIANCLPALNAAADQLTSYYYNKRNQAFLEVNAEGSAVYSTFDAAGQVLSTVALGTKLTLNHLPPRDQDADVIVKGLPSNPAVDQVTR